jgi:hypothetical protein
MELMQAHDGDLYPFDWVVLMVLKRSMALIDGFCTLIENNFICASPLIRLQLDNVLRLSAVFLVSDQDQFAIKLLGGEPVRKMKDACGKPMTDGYLVDMLEAAEPGVKELYEHGSGYVHLSQIHIFHAMQRTERGMAELRIGRKDEFVTDQNRKDAAISMRSVTDILLETIERYCNQARPKRLP